MYQPTNACRFFFNNSLETLPLFMHMGREQPAKPEGQAFFSPGLHSNMAYLIYLHGCCDSCHALISWSCHTLMTSGLLKSEQNNPCTMSKQVYIKQSTQQALPLVMEILALFSEPCRSFLSAHLWEPTLFAPKWIRTYWV